MTQVVMRRDRLCVPVKAGRQGELPKGSVTLAMSSTRVSRGLILFLVPGFGACSFRAVAGKSVNQSSLAAAPELLAS